ncbi:hypothetical protein ACRAWG_33725 [Methylobacterium sp. P31]
MLKLVLQGWPPLFARGIAAPIAALGQGLSAYGRGQRPDLRGFAALARGFLGICVLVDGKGPASCSRGRPVSPSPPLLAILFALGTVLGRGPIGLPPIALTAWQVGLGCLRLEQAILSVAAAWFTRASGAVASGTSHS